MSAGVLNAGARCAGLLALAAVAASWAAGAVASQQGKSLPPYAYDPLFNAAMAGQIASNCDIIEINSDQRVALLKGLDAKLHEDGFSANDLPPALGQIQPKIAEDLKTYVSNQQIPETEDLTFCVIGLREMENRTAIGMLLKQL
jgi:hypothetical protein